MGSGPRASVSAPAAVALAPLGAPGQLVWCPADPLLGVGLIVAAEQRVVTVRFRQAGEERQYTTRGPDGALLRYVIASGERASREGGGTVRVRRRVPSAAVPEPLLAYELEDGTVVSEDALLPEVRDVGAKERLASLTLSHPEVVRARVQGLQLRQLGTSPGVAAVLGARAEWLPHQLDVATQALQRERVRMLLADEVGLGKTVEAALIYAGLRAEGRAARVLVLVPEALCIQWLQELYRKSHELLVLFDQARIADALREAPGTNPFEAHQRMVASLDSVSADPVLAREVEQAEWDLVIVDEAHHLRWEAQGGGNLAYRLVENLAQQCRHLLLLTATPMALDPSEYQALLRLLDRDRFCDPAQFAAASDRARLLSEAARALQAALTEERPLASTAQADVAALLRDDVDDAHRLERFGSLAPGSPARRAVYAELVQSLRERHALADYVTRNRRGPVGGLPARAAHTVALSPSPEQELLVGVGEEIMFELALAQPHGAARARILGELLRALWATPRALVDIVRPYSEELATQLQPHVEAVTLAPLDAQGLPSQDVRLRWLVELVRSLPREDKMLVFVESNVAVRALRDGLEPLLGPVAHFHRELSPRDQDRQVAYFRDRKGPQVMLCTEAGGEGRNFQFCHRVVLYDLPWRPSTVEQRIGRVDRVGQKRDVQVYVPHFNSGFEAAIVKIMQQSIGVLSQTVGGIDHALEYVNLQLAELILSGADAQGWKGLYQSTASLVSRARERIAASADPVLDHASFRPARIQALLASVPSDLEARMQTFLHRYAEHTKVDFLQKKDQRWAVEGAAGASGAATQEGFVGTFGRQDALDHEEVEFLSFGHPLVEQALEWAQTSHDACAALAIARGFDEEGAAFLWTFALGLPDDAAAGAPFFSQRLWTLAIDEQGRRRPELEHLMEPQGRSLDRMDATPLRASQQRWRMLIEHNYAAAEELMQRELQDATSQALARADVQWQVRERANRRAAARRALDALGGGNPLGPAESPDDFAAGDDAAAQLERDRAALTRAIGRAQPSLVAGVAVRLMRRKDFSA